MKAHARTATTRARLHGRLAGICCIAALMSPSVSSADAASRARLALCEQPAHRILNTPLLRALSVNHDGRPPSARRAVRR